MSTGHMLPALGAVLAGTLFVSLAAAPDPEAERFWPQWRGPFSTGASSQATPPLEWSEAKNIRWKIEIPGLVGNTIYMRGLRNLHAIASHFSLPEGVMGSSGPSVRTRFLPSRFAR